MEVFRYGGTIPPLNELAAMWSHSGWVARCLGYTTIEYP
jgi:hypothetical protein